MASETQHPWWTEDNCLLYHGIDINAETKGNYTKDIQNPIPKKGELAASVIHPGKPYGYTSGGVILAPVTPNRMSYTDVGSYHPEGVEADAPRVTKGKVWTPEQMSMRKLVLLTLAGSSYNEALVDASKTRIVGLALRSKETPEEMVQSLINGGLQREVDNGTPYWYTVLASTIPQSETLVHLPEKSECYTYSDRMKEKFGFHLPKELGFEGWNGYAEFAEAVIENRLALDEILRHRNLDERSVFDGGFNSEPITQEQRERVLDARKRILGA